MCFRYLSNFVAPQLLRRVSISLIGLGVAASAGAIPVLNITGGILTGASGIIVDNREYSVEFLDGACVDLFGGCNSDSNFTFHDFQTSYLATQALLDQVLLDSNLGQFDSNPSLTAGCESTPSGFLAKCNIQTPFTKTIDGQLAFRYLTTENTGPLHADPDTPTETFGYSLTPSSATATNDNITWARWTETPVSVPEPSTAALFASCLGAFAIWLGIGRLIRRRSQALTE